MSNVFLPSKSTFYFKTDQLKKLLAAEENKQILPMIDSFSEQSHSKPKDCAIFVKELLVRTAVKQTQQKLLHLIVYFSTLIEADQTIQILSEIKNYNKIPPIILVKFYSLLFKSVNDNNLKKWLIFNSLQAIEKEEKTTPFISFIENFELIIANLQLSAKDQIELYWNLIKYLEKHIIYKKLVYRYTFIGLNQVNEEVISSSSVTNLIVRAIYSDNFDDDVSDVLNRGAIKQHELYPVLQARITGDISALQQINVWEKYQLEKQRVKRKVRIEAIPRLFKHIKQASYAQTAQMLGIEKKEVEGYIIEAIRLGIMKAKLDEYQQTIIINKLNLRCLQKGEQIQLQKQITDLCESLSKMV